MFAPFSTRACLLENKDDWYSGLDLGELVSLVFIDLRKAFDTVQNKISTKSLPSIS